MSIWLYRYGMPVVALVLSCGVGVSLGLLGAGGSSLAVPILVYAGGLAPADAIATSLALVGATSAVAAALHARDRQVDWRAAALFAAAGVPAALAGAQLTHLVPPRLLLALFGLLLLAIGTALLLGATARAASRASGRRPVPAVIGAALAVGALTGFLGVGGGFLLVPAMVLVAGLDLRRATATSLVVIAVNSAAGLAGHLGDGLDAGRTALFIGAAAAGAWLGYLLARRTSPAALQRGFAFLILLVGGAVTAHSLGCLPT